MKRVKFELPQLAVEYLNQNRIPPYSTPRSFINQFSKGSPEEWRKRLTTGLIKALEKGAKLGEVQRVNSTRGTAAYRYAR